MKDDSTLYKKRLKLEESIKEDLRFPYFTRIKKELDFYAKALQLEQLGAKTRARQYRRSFQDINFILPEEKRILVLN